MALTWAWAEISPVALEAGRPCLGSSVAWELSSLRGARYTERIEVDSQVTHHTPALTSSIAANAPRMWSQRR